MTVNRRGVREGLVGILILVGLAVGAGLILWVNNFRPGGDRYQFSVIFEDANGMSPGVPVRLRGVNIGQVTEVIPSIENVLIRAVVTQPGVILPRQARYTVGQRGLIGETFLEILPERGAKAVPVSTQEFQAQCRVGGPISTQVICPGASLRGETPTRVQDLVRSLNTFAERINGGVLNDLQSTVREIGAVARRFGEVTDDVRTTAHNIDATAKSFTKVADSANRTIDRLGTVGNSVGVAANDITAVVRENRSRLATILDSLGKVSQDLSQLTPVLAEPEFGRSLVKLAQNAEASAADLRRLTNGISDAATIDSLRETLDAARSTFRNVEKITADVDQLTGDPKFRENLKKLVDGLGQLVSATETEQVPDIRKVSTIH
ncbi:MlaD family protein [Anthocerotibacter panamensis]|uniref:MlaD family protein n=1 Tax=Anthocerotibacter panamensis TaxID=2857077 RepID=UPI001C404C48|nr:MlaD family protein [Anthocerotibacter panamensis]